MRRTRLAVGGIAASLILGMAAASALAQHGNGPGAGTVGPDAPAATAPAPTGPPGTTTRVSIGADNRQANAASGGASGLIANMNGNQSISADGRWVAFASTATNLVPGFRTPNGGLFLRDRLDGTTIAVPWIDGGAFPAEVEAAEPVLSADGTVLAFTAVFSQRTTVGDVVPYVLTWDRSSGLVEVVSLGPNQQPAPGYQPTISADGNYVAYTQWFVDRTPPTPTNLTTSSVTLAYSPCGPQTTTISATVTDPDDAVSSVTLFYAPSGMSTFSQPMGSIGSNVWQAQITLGASWNLGQISYWVQATDSHGNTSSSVFPNSSNILTLESCIL